MTDETAMAAQSMNRIRMREIWEEVRCIETRAAIISAMDISKVEKYAKLAEALAEVNVLQIEHRRLNIPS